MERVESILIPNQKENLLVLKKDAVHDIFGLNEITSKPIIFPKHSSKWSIVVKNKSGELVDSFDITIPDVGDFKKNMDLAISGTANSVYDLKIPGNNSEQNSYDISVHNSLKQESLYDVVFSENTTNGKIVVHNVLDSDLLWIRLAMTLNFSAFERALKKISVRTSVGVDVDQKLTSRKLVETSPGVIIIQAFASIGYSVSVDGFMNAILLDCDAAFVLKRIRKLKEIDPMNFREIDYLPLGKLDYIIL